MLSRQEEMLERKRTLENDRKVREQQREQASTYLAQTHSEMGGRFSSVGAQTVIGADPVANYPAAAPHQRDPCGMEPPLGYRIDDMEPLEPCSSFSAQGNSGDPADAPSTSAPSGSMSERAGSPTFLKRRRL
jgi:hypothetical protein